MRRLFSTMYVDCSGSWLVSSQGRVATSCSEFPVCEDVRDAFLLLEDNSGRSRLCQRQMRRRFAAGRQGRLQEDFAAPLAPNSADNRLAAVCTSLARLCSTWSDMRQIGPEMPSAPITSPVKL